VNENLYKVRKTCTDIIERTSHGSSFRSLLANIRKCFRKHDLDIELSTRRLNSLEGNEFYVNAYYDAEADQNHECAFEVIVYHNIDKESIFEFDQVSQFVVQIYDAVVHEFKHQEQSRSRNFKPNPYLVEDHNTKSYLADPDEIDAYALSIAIELIRNLGKSRAIQYLHRATRLAKIRPKGLFASPNLFFYFEKFDSEYSPVLRKLIKKVYLNLETLDNNAILY